MNGYMGTPPVLHRYRQRSFIHLSKYSPTHPQAAMHAGTVLRHRQHRLTPAIPCAARLASIRISESQTNQRQPAGTSRIASSVPTPRSGPTESENPAPASIQRETESEKRSPTFPYLSLSERAPPTTLSLASAACVCRRSQ